MLIIFALNLIIGWSSPTDKTFPVVMEFPFDVDAVINHRITRLEGGRDFKKITSSLSSGFQSPTRLQQLELIVDRMGVASAKVPLIGITLHYMLIC